MTNPISLEQRGKVQVSIDFLKRDMWSKYTDGEEIRTLVIGNVNHIESYITKLSASEQAWREEATKVRKGVPTGEYMVLSDGVEVEIYKDPLIVISQIREQLDQAVKELKFIENRSNLMCQSQLSRDELLAGATIIRKSARYGLSSLSQEVGNHEK